MSEDIYLFQGDDPEMIAAQKRARETFRYFWREQFWEYRRIIPGLSVSAVKLPFTDTSLNDPDAEVEQMWIMDIDFDGKSISGKLINSPHYLQSVKEGDNVTVPWMALSDWMYAFGDEEEVCGAFTVNVMRHQMEPGERRQHDNAWGLNFGNPLEEKVLPFPEKESGGGLVKRLFGGKKAQATERPQPDPLQDHPMAKNILEKYEEQIDSDREVLDYRDENGWNQLHHNALAGNFGIVKLLLKKGIDPNVTTADGVGAEALARILDWQHVADYIAEHTS